MRKLKNANQIVQMLREGKKAEEIAESCECALATVYIYAKRNGIQMNGANKTPQDKEDLVVTLYKSGLSSEDVAREVGIAKATARRIRDEYGIAPKHNEYNQWGDYDARLQRAIANIEQRLPGFEYASGFVDCDSPITIRCKKCGTEKTVNGSAIRRKKVCCRNCEAIERENKKNDSKAARREWSKAFAKIEKDWSREYARAMSEWEKTQKTIEKQQPCEDCGRPVGRKSNLCLECANRRSNNKKEIKRRKKIKDALIDRDISLTKLYEMQDGYCYICGGKCNWADKEERNGTIITGDTYPSIDHVIPLALGGMHSWDNVKCACRRCNYLKNDRIIA